MPLVTDKEANSSEDSSDSALDNPEESRPRHHTSWSLSVPPFPGPRRECTNSFCRAAPPPSAVTFCAIQLEIDEAAPEVDVYFNRGKSLEDVFQSLRLDLPSWSDAQKAMSSRKKARGRRQTGEVTVETFLAKEENTGEKEKKGEESKSKESTPASTASSAESGKETLGSQLNFVSGNPFVEVTKGVLHLYKENQSTSLEEGVIRSQMLCMLGVPAKIKTPDLLQFTAPCQPDLDMIRIITDGSSPNQFMVLLRFRCQEAADKFYQAFNGQRFNSLESDVCSLVYVSKVETCKESEYYPMASHTELPLCSICLERMDESVSTVLTILCNHMFHGSCLAQWQDLTCPVCRYVQTPEIVAEQRCSECRSSDDLWICLICGYVGCGRYVGGHSHAHFVETNHCYTMELGQNRVWDYVGDNFVHRLMQTDSADGKLVEAEAGLGLTSGDVTTGIGTEGGEGKCGGSGVMSVVGGVAVNSEEKFDSIQLEYTYLLTSQLEAQRRFYEEKISRLEENMNRELEEMTERTRSTVEESKGMEEKLATSIREKSKAEQKISQLTAKLSKLNLELDEEKQMNESLRKNQEDWQKSHRDLEKQLATEKESRENQVAELSDQLRDVMIYLDSQEKVATSLLREELEGAKVVGVSEASNSPSTSGAAASSARRKTKKKGR